MCSKAKWPKVWFRLSKNGKGEEKIQFAIRLLTLCCLKPVTHLPPGKGLGREQVNGSALGFLLQIETETTAATAWSLRWSQQAGAALLSLILITHSCISFTFHSVKQTVNSSCSSGSHPLRKWGWLIPSGVPRPEKLSTPSLLSADGRLSHTNGRRLLTFSGKGNV